MNDDGVTVDDAAARERAARDLDTSFLVEASAGTGKTSLLVERIMSILASGRATLRDIAAITFTEKAAGELQLRVRRRLVEADSAGTLPPGVAARALAEMGIAPIMTIHAFAASLLRERPVEAGIDPGSRVADEIESRVLLLDAWREWVETAFARPDDALARALEGGAVPAVLERLAELLAEHRDIVGDHVLGPGQTGLAPSTAEVLAEARRFFESLEPWMRGCERLEDAGRRQMESLARRWRLMSALSDDEIAAWLRNSPPPAPAGRQSNWRQPASLVAYRAAAQSLRTLIDARAAADRHAIVAGLVGRMDDFLEYHRVRRRERGWLDFTDVLLEARNLLRDHREVRRYFQERFRYLLVDEFQDTDPLQAEIVFYVAEDAARASHGAGGDGDRGGANDWREVALTPGKLFLVGDPKQSIYRFRRADIEVYEAARDTLTSQSGGRGAVLALSRNFRSSAAVIEFVNRAFEALIVADPVERLQPEYRALAPSEATAAMRGAVRVAGGRTAPGDPAPAARPRRAADIAQAEARIFADEVARIVRLAEPVRRRADAPEAAAEFGDIALLLRTFTHVEAFTSELGRQDIPYRVIGGRSFYERQETHALVALLSAIENPRDRAAVVAALRSPAFGATDEELVLALRDGLFDAGGPRGDAVPPVIRRALAMITEAHAARNRGPLAPFVERVLRESGLVPVFYLRPEGERSALNLEKILGMARRRDDEGGVSLGRFVSELVDLMADAAREPDGGSHDEGTPAVTITTIHRAKGLEFPIVFLANLGMAPNARSQPPLLRVRRARGEFALNLGGPLRSGAWAALDEYEKRAEARERERLLYVAATRARNTLVIVHPGEDGVDHALKALAPYLPPPESAVTADTAAGAATATEFRAHTSEAEGRRLETAELEWMKRLDGIRAAARPHFRLVNPSGLEAWTRAGASPPAGSDPVGGDPEGSARGETPAVFMGRVLHEILARALDEPDDSLRAALERRLRRDGIDGADGDRARELLDAALRSDFLRRARAAPRARTEVGFMLTRRAEAPEETGDIIEGRMDLVFEEGGRLVLVDYKTDRVDGEALAARGRLYRDALAAYRDAARAVTGREVEAWLYFIPAGTAVSLDDMEATAGASRGERVP